MDVKNAFLHGDLQEEIYMHIPPGFNTVQTKGDDDHGIERVKQHLRNEFEVKDLGEMRYFLGIKVSRSSRGGQECKEGR